MSIPRRTALGLALSAAAGPVLAAFRDPLQIAAAPAERLAGSPMTALARPAPGRLVAAGWRGAILVSADGGVRWKQAAVPVSVDLTALAFTSGRHGWATGSDGVLLETDDGGASWIKRSDGHLAARWMLERYAAAAAAAPDDKPVEAALKEAKLYAREAPARPFLDVAFENERTGYVVGAYGLAFRTVDAGRTWLPIVDRLDNPNGYHLYAVAAQRGEVWIAGELGTLLRLDRAQDRFVKVATPFEGTYFTLVASGRSIWAGGLRGNACASSDGGKSWERSTFGGAPPGSCSGGAVLDDGSLVVATQSGQLYRSTDGGLRFEPLPVRAPMAYSAVLDAGAGRLVAAGPQGLRRESLA